MEIRGLEGLTTDRLNVELQTGARFVVFEYCVSLLLFTFKRPSAVFFMPAAASPVAKSLPYTLCSVFLGWWGIPWGPIYTIASLVTNFRGGRDVTAEVVAAINRSAAASPPG